MDGPENGRRGIPWRRYRRRAASSSVVGQRRDVPIASGVAAGKLNSRYCVVLKPERRFGVFGLGRGRPKNRITAVYAAGLGMFRSDQQAAGSDARRDVAG